MLNKYHSVRVCQCYYVLVEYLIEWIYPRHDDQHAARNVNQDEVVTEFPLEQHINFDATVGTRVCFARTVSCEEFEKGEAGQVQFRSDLHRITFFPQEHHIFGRIAILQKSLIKRTLVSCIQLL